MKLLGQDILPMGMGCWAIGGQFYAGSVPHGFTNVNDAESKLAIRATLDAGLRVFDTAAVYGAGHSERHGKSNFRTDGGRAPDGQIARLWLEY